MTDREYMAAARRLALARYIREKLSIALPNPIERAEWLRQQANAIEAEAERAKRPLETFPADPIAEAF